jgi:hypothetical protein
MMTDESIRLHHLWHNEERRKSRVLVKMAYLNDNECAMRS